MFAAVQLKELVTHLQMLWLEGVRSKHITGKGDSRL
jgi:hypothetical protein